MKTNNLYLIVLLIIVAISCKTPNESTSVQSNNSEKTIENPVKENIEESQISKNTATNYSQTIAMTSFSFKIFKKLNALKQSENISFSPVSLNIAMGMVYAGARNSTAEEISKVFGFASESDIFCTLFAEYQNYLNDLSKDTAIEFNLANKVYLENTYKITDDYRQIIYKYFGGAFKSVDFKNNYKIEEHAINSWVSDMTKDRIKNLLPEGTLNESTKMVLVNAIYIKTKWKYPFEKSSTQQKLFYNSETSEPTDFMTQRTTGVKYTEYEGSQVLELPYTTPELSLIIILPKNSNSENLSSAIPNIDAYQEICKNLIYDDVYMEIPKFKTESTYQLAQVLQEMGVVSAFEGGDFSGMTETNDLKISKVIQKVFFEIDEKGSEAAAATAIVMVETSSAYEPEIDDFIEFIANKPFIYIIKENKYNTPLFIGQYVNP